MSAGRAGEGSDHIPIATSPSTRWPVRA